MQLSKKGNIFPSFFFFAFSEFIFNFEHFPKRDDPQS